MLILMNILDIIINVSLIVAVYIIFEKIENIKSTNKLATCFKSLARILQNPTILYLSMYIITNNDKILISYLGTDVFYYIKKIKIFSKTICILLAILNLIQVIYEVILNNGNDVKKSDKIYAIGTIMGITKIFLVIFLIIVVLSIFDIKPSSLLLTQYQLLHQLLSPFVLLAMQEKQPQCTL